VTNLLWGCGGHLNGDWFTLEVAWQICHMET
jgi:hypothetical protein